MADGQLRSEVMGLLLAGYETTANALTWTYYLLSQNLWASERLREEVRQTLGERKPTSAHLAHLPYLRQILDESLRLFPPAWIIGRRAIAQDRIGGYHVPAGTVIAICIYTLHRHPAFWEQADQFEAVARRDLKTLRRFISGMQSILASTTWPRPNSDRR